MFLHATYCFRTALRDPGWAKLISRAAVTLQDFREAFLREVCHLWFFSFPQSSSWVLHNKSLKMWNTEATSSLIIVEHLITAVLFTVCSVSSNIKNYQSEAHIFDERPQRFFSKAFSSEVTYSQSVDCLKSWNLKPCTHQKQNSHCVVLLRVMLWYTRGWTLAESNFRLMFKICRGLTTLTIFSVW